MFLLSTPSKPVFCGCSRGAYTQKAKASKNAEGEEMPHQLVMALRMARSELTHSLPLLLAVMIGSLFPGSRESDRKSSFQTVQKSALLGASPSLPPGPTGKVIPPPLGLPGPQLMHLSLALSH